MINTDFHTLKEKNINSLGVLMTTVSGKEFHPETKKAFGTIAANLCQCILDQRREVYKRLEKFEFNEDHVTNKPHAPLDLRRGAKVRELHNQIFNIISDIIGDTEKIHQGSYIVNPQNNEKYRIEEDFVRANEYMVEGLKKLVDIIHGEEQLDAAEENTTVTPDPNAEQKNNETVVDPNAPKEIIKHKLTQEDFDNNPDLAKAGFNLDDEIDIEEAVERATEIIRDNTPPPVVEPPVDAQPPAVTPTTEIEKQNVTEKPTSRKRTKKTE